jgi:hypothetical protein
MQYKDEVALRNAFATINALSDVYEKYQNGEIQNFGTIVYGYRRGEMGTIEYDIISKNDSAS